MKPQIIFGAIYLDGNQANALQALLSAAQSAQGFTNSAVNMASKAADLNSQKMEQEHEQKMKEIESIKNAPLPPEEIEQQLKDRYNQMHQSPVNVSPIEFKDMVDKYKEAGLSDEDARIITRAKLSKDLDLPNAPDDRKIINHNPEAKAIFASDKGTYSHSSPDGTQETMSWEDSTLNEGGEGDDLYAAQGFANKFTFTSSEIISNLAQIFDVSSPVLNDVFISEIEFLNSELFL